MAVTSKEGRANLKRERWRRSLQIDFQTNATGVDWE